MLCIYINIDNVTYIMFFHVVCILYVLIVLYRMLYLHTVKNNIIYIISYIYICNIIYIYTCNLIYSYIHIHIIHLIVSRGK